MNESIFNLNQPYTIAIRQQWLPPGVTNCMVFNFKMQKQNKYKKYHVMILLYTLFSECSISVLRSLLVIGGVYNIDWSSERVDEYTLINGQVRTPGP